MALSYKIQTEKQLGKLLFIAPKNNNKAVKLLLTIGYTKKDAKDIVNIIKNKSPLAWI